MIKAAKPLSLPTAHIYARCSHPDTEKKGDSVPDQLFRCKEYVKYKLKLAAIIEYKDEARSAYTTGFMQRPDATRLLSNLRKGDHVIVDRLDRICRSALDFLQLIDWFDKHDVTLHIRNFQGMDINMMSAMGRFFVTIWAAVAELESGIKSERIREALAAQRARGEKNASPPIGMCLKKICVKQSYDGRGRGYRKFLQWDPRQRGIMQEIHRMHDENGIGFGQIATILNEDYVARNGLNMDKFVPVKKMEIFRERKRKGQATEADRPKGRKLPWTVPRVQIWYYRERFYRDCELRGITTARDVAIEVYQEYHSKNRRSDKFRSRDLTRGSILKPKLDENDGLPKWAEGRVNSTIHHRSDTYKSLDTLDEFTKLIREAADKELP